MWLTSFIFSSLKPLIVERSAENDYNPTTPTSTKSFHLKVYQTEKEEKNTHKQEEQIQETGLLAYKTWIL